MTNTLLLRLATVLMLFSIHTVQAQTIIANITNSTPDSRYIVHEPHADGTRTATDTVTGLMWQQCSVGQTGTDCSGGSASKHTWQGALGLAASANVPSTAGYSDWRLPNSKELESIVAGDRYDPSINSVVFPNTLHEHDDYYWSSSPYAGSNTNALVVGFFTGWDRNFTRTISYNVRLVRSAQ